MRKANQVEKRLADVPMNEHERQRAIYALREAEAMIDAVVWIKDRIAALGATFLKKPVLKH